MEGTILIVDDEGTIRDAFSRAFIGEGYEVITAASAEEALDLVQGRRVDVAFLDLLLPGMNGVDLCRALKKKNPIMCCFAVTGHRSLFELAQCREAGFEDYFVKPARLGLLFKTAELALDRMARWRL